MNAGAAKVDITPASPAHLAGYAARDHGHESVHDPLTLRALYVSDGDREAALVTADIIWFTEDVIERVSRELEEQLDLDPKAVVFAGTHTHSAPAPRGHDQNRAWVRRLEDQTLSAIAIAKSRSSAVSFRSARGTSNIGVNRREQLPDGRITLGINPDGPCDNELMLTTLTRGDDTTLATIGNFACHGTTLSQRNYELSGDWCGVASAKIEAADKNGAFLYLNGGAANICPRIDRQESFEPVEQFASEFLNDVTETSKSYGDCESEEAIQSIGKTILLPRKEGDIEDGKGREARMRIHGLRIGPLYVLSFPGEIFSQTTIAVKAAHPDKTVMVCSYAGGSSGGYVPVREAYDTGGYEVRVSPYSEAAEAILRNELISLVDEIKS